MNEDNYNSELHDYLEGKLSVEEARKFEDKMAQDPELKREVEEMNLVNQQLHTLGAERFTEAVASWEKEYAEQDKKEEAKVVSFNFRSVYAVAASIVVLVAAGYLLFLRPSASTAELFNNNYTPYEDLILDRGESGVADLLSRAMNNYNDGKYEAAIKHFSRHLEKNNQDHAAWLYLGISQLEIGEYSESEASLKSALEGPMVRAQAEWYLGLMYLKSDQLDKAKSTFENIVQDTSHYKTGQAEKLVRALD